MTVLARRILVACCLVIAGAGNTAQAGSERALFVSTGATARPPIGWVEFCAENPRECSVLPSVPRDVVLNTSNWRELVRINTAVNTAIKPVTDQEHYGVLEKWTFPDDGYGDCEDY